jgi:hypothetical protein
MPDYRITMRKHQYSASVGAKSVFPIVPKLYYIIQYFMIFPTMYSKLGHKLTNVKTASINKVLIAFVHKSKGLIRANYFFCILNARL